MKHYDKILTKLIKTKTKELDDTHFSQRNYWPISLSYIEDDIISDFFKYLDIFPGFIFNQLKSKYALFFDGSEFVMMPKKISTNKIKTTQKEIDKKSKKIMIMRLTNISAGDKRLDDPKFIDKFFKELSKLTKKYK
jgi:hypothetical protein